MMLKVIIGGYLTFLVGTFLSLGFLFSDIPSLWIVLISAAAIPFSFWFAVTESLPGIAILTISMIPVSGLGIWGFRKLHPEKHRLALSCIHSVFLLWGILNGYAFGAVLSI